MDDGLERDPAITADELKQLADLTRNAYPRNDVAVKLACAVKDYLAQEPAREAAVAWAEAEIAYLALRAAQPTETERAK
jgi:hypothetical protein